MKYEIIELDGLFCVFGNDRILSAFEKKEDAAEAVGRYRKKKRHAYYSILRPVGIGTYPKEGMVDYLNFDSRKYIPEIGREAWGILYYDRELSEKEKTDYDLA